MFSFSLGIQLSAKALVTAKEPSLLLSNCVAFKLMITYLIAKFAAVISVV